MTDEEAAVIESAVDWVMLKLAAHHGPVSTEAKKLTESRLFSAVAQYEEAQL